MSERLEVREEYPAPHIAGRSEGEPIDGTCSRPPRTWVIYDEAAGAVEVLVGDVVRLWVARPREDSGKEDAAVPQWGTAASLSSHQL